MTSAILTRIIHSLRAVPGSGGCVAQVSNLLYRRLPVGRLYLLGRICGLDIRDPADWKSALCLRWPGAALRRRFALLALLAALSPCAGQEWTRFRGPNGSGLSAAKTIPAVWTEKDINWKAPLPGPGHSSPVLWGERLFLTTGDTTSNQVWVLCLSASQGQVLWQRGFPIPAYHKNGFNTVASGSPAVDEHRVYVCWTTPERFTLAAFDHEGKRAWEKDLGPFISQHGGGASPIVLGEQVILANQQDGQSFVIAVDAATGDTRWRTARKTAEAGYATPCVYDPGDGQPTLVLASHSHGLSGIDPASGKVLWELAGVFDKRVVSSPVMAAGLIVGACGSGEGGTYLVAARPGKSQGGPASRIGLYDSPRRPVRAHEPLPGGVAFLVGR